MTNEQPLRFLQRAFHWSSPTGFAPVLSTDLTHDLRAKLPVLVSTKAQVQVYSFGERLFICLILPKDGLSPADAIQLFNVTRKVCSKFRDTYPILVADKLPPKARGVLAREGIQYISVRDGQLHTPMMGMILENQPELPIARRIYEPRSFHGTAIAWMAYLLLNQNEIPPQSNFTEWKNFLDGEQVKHRSHPFSAGALHSAVEQMKYFDVLKKIQKGRSVFLEFQSRDIIWKKLVDHCPDLISRRVEMDMDPLVDEHFSELTKISGVSALSEMTDLSQTDERVRMMRSVHFSLFKKKASDLRSDKFGPPVQIEICEVPFDFPPNKQNPKLVNEVILALSCRTNTDPRVRISSSELMNNLRLDGEMLWGKNG